MSVLNLSYGFKKPQNPDTGDVWFVAMEQNIQQLNDHTHDGTNSAPLASQSVNAPSGSWVSVGGGQYRQLVTLPAGFNYDTCQIWVKKTDGTYVYPNIVRASATTCYVYTATNTDNYVLYFR